ncbi:MAG: site-2 protease family protein [Candidatus Cyclobacteriaceae bacterium M3_2C_046]
MKWSLNLGKVLGIKLVIHWTFFILLAWIVFAQIQQGSETQTVILTLAFVLAIFLCVILHEFGHALTARHYGIPTKKITLLPIGGVAGLERMPEEPRKELLIAVAGPLVNVLIALILAFFIPFEQYANNPERLVQAITPQNFLIALFSINVILVLFNIIPAFPMDGGRVLRALLALKMNRIKATNIASKLGQLIAFGFVFLGLFYNPFLILIGIFVYFGAYSENRMVQHLDLLKDFQVKDAMITQFMKLQKTDSLQDAINALLAGSDNHLVVMEDERLAGIISREDLYKAVKNKGMDLPVSEIMNQQFDSFSIETKLTEVYANIQRVKNAFFPVMDDEKLVGVINRDNLNEFVMIQTSLNY